MQIKILRCFLCLILALCFETVAIACGTTINKSENPSIILWAGQYSKRIPYKLNNEKDTTFTITGPTFLQYYPEEDDYLIEQAAKKVYCNINAGFFDMRYVEALCYKYLNSSNTYATIFSTAILDEDTDGQSPHHPLWPEFTNKEEIVVESLIDLDEYNKTAQAYLKIASNLICEEPTLNLDDLSQAMLLVKQLEPKLILKRKRNLSHDDQDKYTSPATTCKSFSSVESEPAPWELIITDDEWEEEIKPCLLKKYEEDFNFINAVCAYEISDASGTWNKCVGNNSILGKQYRAKWHYWKRTEDKKPLVTIIEEFINKQRENHNKNIWSPIDITLDNDTRNKIGAYLFDQHKSLSTRTIAGLLCYKQISGKYWKTLNKELKKRGTTVSEEFLQGQLTSFNTNTSLKDAMQALIKKKLLDASPPYNTQKHSK